ncbi:MAG: hypothetical protein IJK38_11565 [Oscillospiraceae bacterium]|nr:hypothetical protein [Oscillospiraceae bacterium]MBR0392947.1 hypothetical protein [Oscillospiraceae bacterium]
MKKMISLFLAALLVFALTVSAFADNDLLNADPDEVMSFDRESPVTDWEGDWVLAAAFIGEDFADENDIETVGMLAVPEGAVKMTVKAILDGSATGSDAGVMVDQGSYLHAHVYDMEATITFPEDITDDEATLKLPWDGWLYTVRGEDDGDFNMGVGKLSKVAADDKSLYFAKVTGVENEAISDENMKYVGMNEGGQLIVCYSDDNMVKKDGDVAFAYIFVRVEE